MTVDFGQLNLAQRKILRQAIAETLDEPRKLLQFLQDHGFTRTALPTTESDIEELVVVLVSELRRTQDLDRFVQCLRKAFDSRPCIADLDHRLALVSSETENSRALRSFGFEKFVRASGFQDVLPWIAQLSVTSNQICKISIPVSRGRLIEGSGVLVGADQVLTCYHVVRTIIDKKIPAHALRVTFGHAETADGTIRSEVYHLGSREIECHAPFSPADLPPYSGDHDPKELDFALLHLADAPGNVELTGGKRGWLTLSQLDDVPTTGAIVVALQHPGGNPLKLSFGEMLARTTPLRARYDADTLEGSSGGLILNQRLEPIALHHAGGPGPHPTISDPVPRADYNQGIPLKLIAAALSAESKLFGTGDTAADSFNGRPRETEPHEATQIMQPRALQAVSSEGDFGVQAIETFDSNRAMIEIALELYEERIPRDERYELESMIDLMRTHLASGFGGQWACHFLVATYKSRCVGMLIAYEDLGKNFTFIAYMAALEQRLAGKIQVGKELARSLMQRLQRRDSNPPRLVFEIDDPRLAETAVARRKRAARFRMFQNLAPLYNGIHLRALDVHYLQPSLSFPEPDKERRLLLCIGMQGLGSTLSKSQVREILEWVYVDMYDASFIDPHINEAFAEYCRSLFSRTYEDLPPQVRLLSYHEMSDRGDISRLSP